MKTAVKMNFQSKNAVENWKDEMYTGLNCISLSIFYENEKQMESVENFN